jgi:hypothetical protein
MHSDNGFVGLWAWLVNLGHSKVTKHPVVDRDG